MLKKNFKLGVILLIFIFRQYHTRNKLITIKSFEMANNAKLVTELIMIS